MSCLTRDLSLYFIIHINCANVNNTQGKTQERCLFAACAACLYLCEHLYLRINIGDSVHGAVAAFTILCERLHGSSSNKQTSLGRERGMAAVMIGII